MNVRRINRFFAYITDTLALIAYALHWAAPNRSWEDRLFSSGYWSYVKRKANELWPSDGELRDHKVKGGRFDFKYLGKLVLTKWDIRTLVHEPCVYDWYWFTQECGSQTIEDPLFRSRLHKSSIGLIVPTSSPKNGDTFDVWGVSAEGVFEKVAEISLGDEISSHIKLYNGLDGKPIPLRLRLVRYTCTN